MESLIQEIKELLVNTLQLEGVSPADIETEAPLFGEGLGLDSIDALELGIALQKKYKVKLESDSENNKSHFKSIHSLALYIQQLQMKTN